MAEEQKLKHMIRVANTDLVGSKNIVVALRKIKGVNIMLANALCAVSNVDKTKRAGELNDNDVRKLNDSLNDIVTSRIPAWMFNRRKDYDTGADKHIITSTLQFQKETDIKKLMKIKSYRGLRLSVGLPVRGQRTKSNFRKSKSKGKSGSLGVKRKGKK